MPKLLGYYVDMIHANIVAHATVQKHAKLTKASSPSTGKLVISLLCLNLLKYIIKFACYDPKWTFNIWCEANQNLISVNLCFQDKFWGYDFHKNGEVYKATFGQYSTELYTTEAQRILKEHDPSKVDSFVPVTFRLWGAGFR